MTYAPITIQARRVLLDALAALEDHRAALVLVGAQAIYLYTGEADVAIATQPRHDARDIPHCAVHRARLTPPGGVQLHVTKHRPRDGVEEPVAHNVTSRTGDRTCVGSRSISRYGDACAAAISAAPVNTPLSRRNSSAATTTTSSRP